MLFNLRKIFAGGNAPQGKGEVKRRRKSHVLVDEERRGIIAIFM